MSYEQNALIRWTRSLLPATLATGICGPEDLGRPDVLIEMTDMALKRCQLEVDIKAIASGSPPEEFLNVLVHTVTPADKADSIARDLVGGNPTAFLWELVQLAEVRPYGFGSWDDLFVYLKSELSVSDLDVPKMCLLTCDRVSKGRWRGADDKKASLTDLRSALNFLSDLGVPKWVVDLASAARTNVRITGLFAAYLYPIVSGKPSISGASASTSMASKGDGAAEEIQRLKAELAEAEGAADERDELMAELDKTLSAAEESMREIQRLQTELEVAHSKAAKLASDHELREAETKAELQKTLEAAENALQQVLEAQEEASGFEEKAEALSERVTQLEQVNADLVKQVDNGAALLERSEQLRAAAENDAAQLLQLTEELKQTLASAPENTGPSEELKGLYDEAVRAKDELALQLSGRQLEMDVLKARLQELEASARSEAQAKNAICDQLDALNREHSALKSLVTELQVSGPQSMEHLQAELETCTRSKEALQDAFNSLHLENGFLKSRLEQEVAAGDLVQTEMIALKSHVDQLDKARIDAERALEESNHVVSSLKRENDALNHRLAEEIALLQQQLNGVANVVATEQQEAEMKMQLVALQNELTEARASLADKSSIIQDAQSRLEAALSDRRSLEQRLEESLSTQHSLQQEIEQIRHIAELDAQEAIAQELTLQHLEAARDAALGEAQRLADELVATSNESQDLGLLREQNAALAARLVESERERAKLLGELEQTAQMSHELGAQVESTEVLHLRSELERRNTALEALQTAAEEASSQCEALLHDLEHRDSELVSIGEALERTQRQMETQSAELVAANASLEKARAKLEPPFARMMLAMEQVRPLWKNSQKFQQFEGASMLDTDGAVCRVLDAIFQSCASDARWSGPVLRHCAAVFKNEDSLWNFVCNSFMWANECGSCRMLTLLLRGDGPSLEWSLWSRSKLYQVLGIVPSNGTVFFRDARSAFAAVKLALGKVEEADWQLSDEGLIDVHAVSLRMASLIASGKQSPLKVPEDPPAPIPLPVEQRDVGEHAQTDDDLMTEHFVFDDDLVSVEEKRAAAYLKVHPLVPPRPLKPLFSMKETVLGFQSLIDSATLDFSVPLPPSIGMSGITKESLGSFVDDYCSLMFLNIGADRDKLKQAFRDFVIIRLSSLLQQIRLACITKEWGEVKLETFKQSADTSSDCELLMRQDAKLAPSHLKNFCNRLSFFG